MKALGVIGTFLLILVVWLLMAIPLGLFFGWIFMLLLGTLHANVSEAIPAIGYWACFWPAVLIRMLLINSPSTSSSTSK